MEFLEKDLEDIIWEAYQSEDGKYGLFDKGLPISSKMYRQVNLGDYGILDLMTVSINPNYVRIAIYELKRDIVDISTMAQAARYGTGINKYIEERCNIHNRSISLEFFLIGKTIDRKSDFVFLYSNSPYFKIYLYKYGLNGIHFKYQQKNWEIKEANIPNYHQPISEIKSLFEEVDSPF